MLVGTEEHPEDEFRLAQIGYDRIAKAARITKRNAALIVERLIAKGFVTLETPADPLHRRPSQYRVLGYTAALEELHRRGRHWVVRSGNGVLFVHPLTVVVQPTATVFAESPTTIVTATTPRDSPRESKGQSSSSALLEVCSRAGVVLDTAAERTILKRCRAYDPTATDEEIAYFASVKITQLRSGRRMGDLVDLLMTAVPEFFVEPAYELQAVSGREGVSLRQAPHSSPEEPRRVVRIHVKLAGQCCCVTRGRQKLVWRESLRSHNL